MNIHYLQHAPHQDIGNMRAWFVRQHAFISHSQMYLGTPSFPEMDSFNWLIVLGGPMSSYDDARFPWLKNEKLFIERAIKSNKVVIGICLGAQLIAEVLGARVYPNCDLEIGWFPVWKKLPQEVDDSLSWLPEQGTYLNWHGDTFALPQNATHIAYSELTGHQGFVYRDQVVGLQFHLEATTLITDIFLRARNGVLPSASFVQSVAQVRGDSALYHYSKKVMHQLLDSLAVKSSEV